MDTSRTPESFRSLLLRDRGRTGLTQRDLAARAGVSLRSVQDWEAGVTLPTAERLQGLVRALLEAGGLTSGQEAREALELWTAVERETPRMHAPFDEEWFAGLLAAAAPQTSAAEPVTSTTERLEDWGEAPDTAAFVGRSDELALLQKWVLEDRCRLVAVLGMGGIGKTSLAAWVTQQVAPSFERVYWRSLRNAPPVPDWLAGAIAFLSDQQLVPPESESDRIIALLQLLRTRRCLLVLDNSETLFEPGHGEGRYRAGMEGYGRTLQAVGETTHQSCLILTSREAPPELAILGGGARSLELHGLGVAEAQKILADKQLKGDTQEWLALVNRYSGNGLALKIVGETIRQIYAGEVGAFMAEAVATYGAVFGGIRRLLDVQAERLSTVERDILKRLAVEREPISLAQLSREMASSVPHGTVVEAIQALGLRSLVERREGGPTFTLQAMVLEYVTDRLVETVADEIGRGQPVVLVDLPLIKAQAKDYVRQTQERLIGGPILQRLNAQHTEVGTEHRLLALLDLWRGRPAVDQGYGPGNVVNLLRLHRGNLRGLDMSRLALQQVYLEGVDAQEASLSGADLAGVVLDEAFAYPTSVAVSADGAYLMAGTPTGEVRLWTAADRRLLLAAQGHSGVVWGVALAADGELLASSGADGLVKLWEAGSGQILATLKGHTGVVQCVALSGDGSLVASGGDDGTVRLWSFDTSTSSGLRMSGARSGQLRVTLQGHAGGVRGVALSTDGRLLASGGADGTIRLWRAEDGQLLATLEGHIGGLRGVALSGDGRMVASGGADGTVRLWWVDGGQLLAALQGHTGAVMSLALSGDGRLLASGGADSMVRLWETESCQLLALLQGHTGVVLGVALSSDGLLLGSASWDGTVRLWEAGTGQSLATLRGHTGMIMGVALSGDERVVASAGVDGTVRLWSFDERIMTEAESRQALATLHGHVGAVHGVRLSEDGRLLVSGGVDGTVRLWDVRSGRLLTTLQGHTGGVWCVALSSDGRLIASGGVDGTVRLCDVQSDHLLAILQGHTGLVWSVALSRDKRLVVSGGMDGTVRLWSFDERSMTEVASVHIPITLQGDAGPVLSVAVSADGHMVASSGADGIVRLWAAATGRPLATLQGHKGAALSVALSADGRLVASGGADGTVRLWDAGSSQLLATLEGHSGVVSSVALSSGGQLLATGGDDGIVRLWDTVRGDCLRTLRGDRHYQRLDITGLVGVTEAQRAALLALGAIEVPASGAAPAMVT